VAIRGVDTELYRCPQCGLFEFPEPDWLDAAYSDPIADIDVGLASRCVMLSGVIEAIVRAERLGGERLLDYGGGLGLLTRLCRDRGLDMRQYEPMAANLFAQGLEASPKSDFAVVSLVEVFEHLTDPLDVLSLLSEKAELVIVSTELVPAGLDDLTKWHYLVPDLGQHVTFYTVDALRRLAQQTGYQLTTDGRGLHVFSRKTLSRRARAVLNRPRLAPVLAKVQRRRDHAGSFTLADAAAIQEAANGAKGAVADNGASAVLLARGRRSGGPATGSHRPTYKRSEV